MILAFRNHPDLASVIRMGERSELTGLKTFVTTFAGHVAAEAARSG